MNYEEMEMLFRDEQRHLGNHLTLRPEAINPAFFHRNWKPVKEVNFIHRLGANLAFVYGTISLFFAYVQWQDLHASILLVVGGVGMFANGWLLPPQALPTKDLEKFSVAALIEKLVAFRRYAMHRIWFDCLVVLLFVFGLVTGYLNFYSDINLFLNPSAVPKTFWTVGLVLISITLIAAVGGNAKQMRQLKEIEHQLAGYRDDDLV